MYYIVQKLEWETAKKSDEIWIDFVVTTDLCYAKHFMNSKWYKVIRKEGSFIPKKLKEIDDGFLMDCYTSDIMDAYNESRNDWD